MVFTHRRASKRERQDEEVARGVKGRGGYDTDTGAKNPHPTLRTYIKLARVYSLKYYIRNWNPTFQLFKKYTKAIKNKNMMA